MFPNFSLRWKILLVILPLIIVTIIIFTVIQMQVSLTFFHSNNKHFITALANQLSFNIGRGYEIQNSRSLYRLIEEYIAYDPQIADIIVVAHDGEITGDHHLGKVFTMNKDPDVFKVIANGSDIVKRYSEQEKEFYKLVTPIYVWETKKINGALILQYDVSPTFHRLTKLQESLILGSIVLMLLLVVGITIFLKFRVTDPLEYLTHSVGQVNISDPQVPDFKQSSGDEIGTLAEAFTRLIKELRKANAELKAHNVEIESAYRQLKETKIQLTQSEKMASLGLLTAGIAHEVNNPMNFVYGNLGLIEDFICELNQLLRAYNSAKIDKNDRMVIHDLKEKMDFDNKIKDIEGIIKDCKTGARRIIDTVRDLRNFSRLDNDKIEKININDNLDLTLKFFRTNLKDQIVVKKNYGDLPLYLCYSGQINQVFMNILINAVQAIEGKGSITIRTYHDEKYIYVEISDTGKGIPREIIPRIFDPFFTTKDVGIGTGLGLSICYQIVQQHGGTILIDSEATKGTRITVQLPIHGMNSNGK